MLVTLASSAYVAVDFLVTFEAEEKLKKEKQ